MVAASESLHARFANNAAIFTIQKEYVPYLYALWSTFFEGFAQLNTYKLGEQV